MRSVFGWVLSRASLYLLIVAALLAAPWVVGLVRSPSVRSDLQSPREIGLRIDRLRVEALTALERTAGEVRAYPAARIESRLGEARAERARLTERLKDKGGWFSSLRPSAILEHKQSELRLAAIEGEIRLLEAAGEERSLQTEIARVMAPTPQALAASLRICDAARSDLERFDERNAVDRSLRNLITAERDRLRQTADRRCEEHRSRVAARQRAIEHVGLLRDRLQRARAAYDHAGREAEQRLRALSSASGPTVRTLLFQAGVILAGILLTPYAVRTVFYFVLAPLAGHRAPVRLSTSAGAAPPTFAAAGPSGTSVAITVQPDEALLVRQGFLQSTSLDGRKSTRALLDWRHPLSSLASGLVFLTRVAGGGAEATVSAVRDPLAEVAVLELASGAACVLHPRALVGVVQPRAAPVRITSHWRLGSLHAWLTLQLRYLMFHGPVRLIVKGGRGVRIEGVERGRVFAQDQLVGFSADLAYSTVRAETFWPYFFGLEQLLQDKVEAGRGLLILEEAPAAATAGRRPGRGLEGAADVLLKLVGL